MRRVGPVAVAERGQQRVLLGTDTPQEERQREQQHRGQARPVRRSQAHPGVGQQVPGVAGMAQHPVGPGRYHRLVRADHDRAGEVVTERLDGPPSQHQAAQQDRHPGGEGGGGRADGGGGHDARGQVERPDRDDHDRVSGERPAAAANPGRALSPVVGLGEFHRAPGQRDHQEQQAGEVAGFEVGFHVSSADYSWAVVPGWLPPGRVAIWNTSASSRP